MVSASGVESDLGPGIGERSEIGDYKPVRNRNLPKYHQARNQFSFSFSVLFPLKLSLGVLGRYHLTGQSEFENESSRTIIVIGNAGKLFLENNFLVEVECELPSSRL